MNDMDDDAENISANSPSAVLFEIKHYELNEEGVPIFNEIHSDADDKSIVGEALSNVMGTKQSVKHQRVEDAEPDPINYDIDQWEQYNALKQKYKKSLSESHIIGCRLRCFQCFSFLACLTSIIAILTDDLTAITGQRAYGYYSDSIVCGWNALHIIEYDDSLGITERSIPYDHCSDEDDICNNLNVDGLVWMVLSTMAAFTIFGIVLLFCCVFPLNPRRYYDYKLSSAALLIMAILFEVIAVIVWVSGDYCSETEFIRQFYNKEIRAINSGPSIDVIVCSMLCCLLCIAVIISLHFQKR